MRKAPTGRGFESCFDPSLTSVINDPHSSPHLKNLHLNGRDVTALRYACHARHAERSSSLPFRNIRRERLVAALHRLGPAPLAYFLAEIERGADIDRTLEIYARLPADFISAYGGDHFPPALWPAPDFDEGGAE